MVIIRYADDTVLGFEHRYEAERFLADLRARVQGFGLALHAEKTRLIAFGRFANRWNQQQGRRKAETFNFLGFTHICSVSRASGWFELKRTTIAKRMHVKLAELKASLWRAMHWTMREAGRWLASVLRGYYQYHAVPGNLRRLYALRWRLMMCWWRVLRRRSQRHRLPWERFFRIVNHWLPEPRVVHPYPDARFRAKHSR
jgi:RNA-directed DNA polymerase